MSVQKNPPDADRVPLFGSWRNAYVAVVAVFVVDVVLFYAISRYFA
ncbi:MAG TPA: hypothetical protein VK993_07625 [Chthoniobacterales bacterium]|nr:hypothetical protein [Chthoniobacterales bacterium]